MEYEQTADHYSWIFPPILSAPTVAWYIGSSPAFVYGLIQSGKLRALRLTPSSHHRIRASSLAALVGRWLGTAPDSMAVALTREDAYVELPKLLDSRAVADRLQVHERTVLRLLAGGVLPGFRLGPDHTARRWRVTQLDCDLVRQHAEASSQYSALVPWRHSRQPCASER